MIALAVIGAVVALAVLIAMLVVLVGLRRQLDEVSSQLAARPVGLSGDDAATLAEHAAWAAVRADRLPPMLSPPSSSDRAGARPSVSRIKVAGWAAGATETARRLRRGA